MQEDEVCQRMIKQRRRKSAAVERKKKDSRKDKKVEGMRKKRKKGGVGGWQGQKIEGREGREVVKDDSEALHSQTRASI